jgi:PE-PPE domain
MRSSQVGTHVRARGAAVSRQKLLAHVGAIGAIVGAAYAMNGPAAQADDSLAGSETAIILGGTGEPTPSTEFAQAAEDLYLHPLGFDGGATDSTVCDMIGTDPCAAPLQVLATPELFQQGPSSLTGADDVVLAVENEFNANPGAFSAEHPLTIFGYSQSATAESIAMTRLEEAGIPSADLHFVFIGDPSLPVTGVWSNLVADMDTVFGSSLTNTLLTDFGMDGVLGSVTPDDAYPATIYSFEPDPVSNFQQVFEAKGLFGALLDIFGPHVEYLGLTPAQIADATMTTDGQLTLVDISDADVNNADAWLTALLEHGVADSGPFQSVFQSLELLFFNTY